MTEFAPAIRRALRVECCADLLGPFMRRNPTQGMASRPAFKRLSDIHDWLLSGRNINATIAARAYGCSTKTIHRDITFLRAAFLMSIQWDSARCSFYVPEATR